MSFKKTITISTDYPEVPDNQKQSIKIEMRGGNPYFSFIFIDGECYTLRKKPRVFEIEKVR